MRAVCHMQYNGPRPTTNHKWSKCEARGKQRLQQIRQKVNEVAKELDAIAKEDVEYTKSLLHKSETTTETDLFDP